MNFVEKGYESDCKIYVSVIVLGDKIGYIYQSTLVYLQLDGGLAPLRALWGKDALRGKAPWRRFLPSFGNLHFQVFRGGPFPSLGRGDSRFFSPIILLCGDTNSLGLDV